MRRIEERILFQKVITRDDLRANTQCLYLFGDNLENRGLGGQAAEMRGEPNAVGIPTKYSPSIYLNDHHHFELVRLAYISKFSTLMAAKRDGRIIVIPADGLGTGLAKLETKAPRIWGMLQDFMRELVHE